MTSRYVLNGDTQHKKKTVYCNPKQIHASKNLILHACEQNATAFTCTLIRYAPRISLYSMLSWSTHKLQLIVSTYSALECLGSHDHCADFLHADKHAVPMDTSIRRLSKVIYTHTHHMMKSKSHGITNHFSASTRSVHSSARRGRLSATPMPSSSCFFRKKRASIVYRTTYEPTRQTHSVSLGFERF